MVKNANVLDFSIISNLFSMPLNQAPGLRIVYLFADNLWLYNYDKIKHEGTLDLVFNTTSII